MNKFNILLGAILFIFIFGIASPHYHAAVKPEKKLQEAPVNPEFLKYLDKVKTGQYRTVSESGHPLGYIPFPVDLSHMKGAPVKINAAQLPASYDLRNYSKLTSVKNQASCGSCWAFATMASLESSLMPSEENDFSEQHLITTHGFDYGECVGGNGYMSTAYLARWDGPLNESTVPYIYTRKAGYTPVKHVQQVIFLPARSTQIDNDTIKHFVYTYGGVIASYNTIDSYYNTKYNSYYYDGGTETNHGVTIVGWNDDFPASQFKKTPPGDGAFIVKNSWGTSWGENGYFYLSYWDTSLSTFMSFNNAESTNNYSRLYYYDNLGWINSYGYSEVTAWGANVFTAEATESLKAVGFYLDDVNASYEIYIYTGVTMGDPRTGTLKTHQSGSKIYSGYYTVPLDTPVSLTKNETFSVVIKITNSTYIYPIAVEKPNTGYATNVTGYLGESYISDNGIDWTDMAGAVDDANICIKAYAGSSSTTTPKITLNRTSLNYGATTGSTYTSAQSITISNSGTGTLNWSLSKSSNSTWLSYTPSSGTNSGQISVSVNPSGLSTGTYTGYIYVTDSYASNSPKTITVNLNVMNTASTNVPFGEFATPTEQSTVYSSVPITGWVLDDIEVSDVKIYNGNSYVGDAVFIEGARPDVEAGFSSHPFSYKSGWGYMMLTNFLPNGGNGWYTIYAIATDKEGHSVTLGSKNIFCDNAHATSPFGAIDTPTQGGEVSGKSYVNFGWVLTPQPNYIPTNGSTINAYIDGVAIGKVTYNQYRADLAALFPDYANTSGAAGYRYIDTTKYSNGTHSIYWVAYDNAGNSGGIGSRFFTVMNGSSSLAEAHTPSLSMPAYYSVFQIASIPRNNISPLKYKKGYNEDAPTMEMLLDETGTDHASFKQDERIRVYLEDNSDNSNIHFQGYQVIGTRLRPLPVGSTLDEQSGVFYWQPPAGFYGKYEFVFIAVDNNGPLFQKKINIDIKPKHE